MQVWSKLQTIMELKCIQIQTEIGLLFFPFRNPGYSHICKAHQLNVLVEYMYVLAGHWEGGGEGGFLSGEW